MTTTPVARAWEEPASVSLPELGQELSYRLKQALSGGEAPALLARMSNLLIFCNRADLAERVEAEIPAIVCRHPARVLLLIGEGGGANSDVEASIRVRTRHGERGQLLCSEEVTLHARGAAVERLPFAVRELLIGDLPTNLWWATPLPPPLAGGLLYDLAENAQQIIYDSNGWVDPHRGVAATAAWLTKLDREPGRTRWRVASDLNWRRLKYWRRLLSQALDPASAPGALESITEVIIEHGPHAVTQAWELIGWLASRLRWRVEAARVQPGVQLDWQVAAPHGKLRLRIHRLAEGPSEVRQIRIACALGGKPGVLNFLVQDDRRLAVVPEGVEAAPRTLTTQPQGLAEMVARQLSDREPDPIFRESMAVAQVFAESILE
jgi:glucose-6-phosphate dehydrogenase assembly protein OpcA